MGTSKSTWTRSEAALAAIFGGRRRPLSGSLAGDDDVQLERIYGESKVRASWSVFSLFRTVKTKAQKSKKIPILRLKEKHAKGGLLVVHEDDLDAVIVERLAAMDDGAVLEIEAAVRLRRGVDDDGG